ncbi:hypothetical protein P5V15_009641 [Pogonomyrmex californicus]
MGDSTAKSSHAECAKPQKKTISPDVMLHTRNVMIPVVKPVPPKQSFNISYLEYKPAILRVPNYKNNPALLFSETPLHTLYDPKNSPEVKKLSRWKCKNQSTKYTTSCSSKRLSRKRKDNMLCFPNTTFTQFESSANDQDLHKASSRSIELSRKCDLSRVKENQIKRRDMIAVLPKIEAPISSVMSKSAVSSESQSFHDIVNSISTVLPLSVSSLKIKNKRTFANIVKRKESLSSVTSNHLHPTNSEYEINVLHYENDIPRNDFSHFTQSHLKSTNTNWSFTDDYSLTKIQNYDFTKEKNVMENKAKAAHDIKYSCEINNWILPSQREERDSICETKIIGKNGRNPYDCKIKYSWQVIGTSTQTSYSLLQDLLNNSDIEDHNRNIYKMRIKYSWQIIGMSTQASLHSCSDPDYWNGILLAPNKNCNENEAQIGNNETVAKPRDHVKYLEKRSKKYLILNNQQTQTFAEKEIQADTSDCNAKYSWHNLIKQYLIPAVPYSEELPNINFDHPLNSYKEEIMEQISRFGCISRTVPVHIMSIEERPAGLFVKWHVTNPEYIAEEQTFIVEKANGEILDPTSSKFETVYKGFETFCFIRNIPIDEPITLRVRIQADNVARSIHHVARTSIPSYSWELNNKDYLITNNGKIAAKVTDAISTLFSQDSQFDANHIIEFKFLEIPQEGSDDEGIALVYDPQGRNDTLKRAASLMITAQGKIFMDGDEKLMRLPRMHSATHITISAFRKNVHVLRVNIESENKCVTYDWRVQTPLYLAARFTERNKWHLAIE